MEVTDAAKAHWADIVKQLGFPIVVASVLLYVGQQQIEIAGQRFDKQQEFITTTLTITLEKSNAVISAINVTLTAINITLARLADEQVQTRQVIRDLRADAGHGPDS